MRRDSRTAGQGRALRLDARPAAGQSDFSGTRAERAQAEAVAGKGNSLAHQSHPRVQAGEDRWKVAVEKRAGARLQRALSGVTLWQSREAA